MPLEIKELVIRASIGPDASDSGQASSPAAESPLPIEAIIKKCVEQVLEILKENDER